MRPNWRELNVLQELCLGSVEPSANFRDAGKQTIAGMIAKGWIEEGVCEHYGVEGYRITEAGTAIFSASQK